jgi:cortexillin 1/2
MADRDNKDKKWEQVQIKAFKSWVNSTLNQKGISPVDDVEKDFQDGVKLIQFLEIVSGKAVNGGKYDKKPAQKIQKIQNLNLALIHIQNVLGVKLVSIGAEDVYDGHLKLILGMLWTLFRALRISSIKEGGHSSEDALLIWVKKMTEGYDGVNITNFKESFADGLAFSALINKFDSDLLNYGKLNKTNIEGNLENAFSIAEGSMGVPKLLDASDLMGGNPDERSVILYVSLFFHAFVSNEDRQKDKAKQGEITKRMTDLESMIEELEEEKEELLRNKRSLQERVTELEQQAAEREAALKEAREKINLLESELEFYKDRAIADAETIALLEEKNRLLQELLDGELFEKGELDESKARLLAELEELKNRNREQAGEKESLDEMRRRLISENEKKEGILSAIEARNKALMNEIDQLRKLIKAEMQKRKDLLRNFLNLQKELEALQKKQIAQGKARVALDILRRNLEEHLEDMYRWRELHNLSPEDETTRVFDLDKVTEDLKNKTFEQQLEYLDEQLQAENKSLLRIIRLKDSEFQLKELEVKSGWLFMKGRKDWKKRWFSLRGFTLYYYENDSGEKAHEGLVDLNRGCEVVRQKAVKEDDSAKKQWPLKITVGERKLFVRAATKKERHSWYLFLASKIAHLNYLKSVEASGNRADTRMITLFNSETVTDLHLDHRPLRLEGAGALSKTLPAHDETENLSLVNSGIDDAALKPIADVLEKLSLKVLDLSRNEITGDGLAELSKGITNNLSLTELNLENNKINDAGIAHLATALAAKPAITSVNLNGNQIGAAGVKSLKDQIGHNERVFTRLHLNNNKLGDAGAAAVATLLSSNSTITHVHLSGNGIGDAGVASLCQAISPDSLVVELDLSNNDLTSAGASHIQKLLQKNTTIVKINLSGNAKLQGSEVLAPLMSEGFSFPSFVLSRV